MTIVATRVIHGNKVEVTLDTRGHFHAEVDGLDWRDPTIRIDTTIGPPDGLGLGGGPEIVLFAAETPDDLMAVIGPLVQPRNTGNFTFEQDHL